MTTPAGKKSDSVTQSGPSEDARLPAVAIIILTWNRRDVTLKCLRSLRELTYPNCEVIVVDNASSDDTVAYVRQNFPSVTLIENEKNLGFAAGCNVGIRRALAKGADYIFLLNNDTIVPRDLLHRMLASAEDAPDEVAVFSPMLYYLDEPDVLWFSGSSRHWLTLEVMGFGPLGPRRDFSQRQNVNVDYIFGTAMLLRASALRRVGLFDEDFFLYYEDMDLCLRMKRAGYDLHIVPEAQVGHQVSASTREMSATRYYHKARSSVIFFRKHTGWIRRAFVVPYRLGSALRTLGRLLLRRQVGTSRAFLRGLWDGLRATIAA